MSTPIPAKPRGVSMVLCCHNGAARLKPTIEAIAAQRVTGDLDWELLFVDNASTDGSADLVRELWPASMSDQLRITYEERPGTGYARWRGLAEARYEYVSFSDDDTWLCDGWIEKTAKILDEHPDVGACGGEGRAVFECDPPAWFREHEHSFAVGPQTTEVGYMTSGVLWGAGMGIRSSAWSRLIEEGYTPFISGRQGNKSMAPGEDTEICFALLMAGWRLWYAPELKYDHYMPCGRLTWNYLRRMYRGFGSCIAAWEPYVFVQRYPVPKAIQKMRQLWIWRLQAACRQLLRKKKDAAKALRAGDEGGWEVLKYEIALGALLYLWRDGRDCGKKLQMISEARWRHPAVEAGNGVRELATK